MPRTSTRSAERKRLLEAFDLSVPDRPPIMGGWLAAPDSIRTITGCSNDEYWEDPFEWGLQAEAILGSDGVIGIFEPIGRDGYRCVDGRVMDERAAHSVESVLAYIDALPDRESIEAAFDEDAAYQEYRSEFDERTDACGNVCWCPAEWQVIPHGLWYHEFGYEASMLTLGLHPERYRKLIETSAVEANQRATVIARSIKEGLTPPALLTGEDLCSQEGPMVSPEYLRREYFPLLEYAIEPLLKVGARLIWHCDGAYQELLDDVLACGIAGLQGFQSECGMDLEWIVKKRTRNDDRLIVLGPMSVTTTLPHGSTADVKAEVQRAMDLTRDEASLVFFTSNTINPDVPVANLRTFWETVRSSEW